MFGFTDFWIGVIYALTVLSGLWCVVYGFLRWNKDNDEITETDAKWANEEKKIEKEIS